MNSARFSADGKRVVTASDDNTASLWNAESGTPVGARLVHGDRVLSAVFSADGRRVLTASADKTARVWDAETGKPVAEPLVHADAVHSAVFSADGKRVLTASADKTARFWAKAWPSRAHAHQALVNEACASMGAELFKITEGDIQAVSVLASKRIGENVCEGVVVPLYVGKSRTPPFAMLIEPSR